MGLTCKSHIVMEVPRNPNKTDSLSCHRLYKYSETLSMEGMILVYSGYCISLSRLHSGTKWLFFPKQRWYGSYARCVISLYRQDLKASSQSLAPFSHTAFYSSAGPVVLSLHPLPPGTCCFPRHFPIGQAKGWLLVRLEKLPLLKYYTLSQTCRETACLFGKLIERRGCGYWG